MKLYMANSWSGQDTHVCLKTGEIRHAFSSFWYHGTKVNHCGLIRRHVADHVVDSGAHSFFSESEMGSARNTVKKTKEDHDPHEYFARYLEWLKSNENDLDFFVELDIGELVGQKVVEKWRTSVVKAGLAEKCIIVFHPRIETFEHFKDIAKQWPSRYVGLEGVRGQRVPMDYIEVCRVLYDLEVKAHGFAMIKPKWMTRIPFYSVDSASFTAGTAFGRVVTTSLPRRLLRKTGGVAKGYRTHQNPVGSGYYDADLTSAVALQVAKVSPDLISTENVINVSKKKSAIADKDELIRVRGAFMAAAAREYNRLEDELTRLWESRGVLWEKSSK